MFRQLFTISKLNVYSTEEIIKTQMKDECKQKLEIFGIEKMYI